MDKSLKTLTPPRSGQMTRSNFALLPEDCTTPRGVSETVPNEVESLRDILMKHIKGMSINPDLVREGHFSDDEDYEAVDLEEISRMELPDKIQAIRDVKERIKQFEMEIENEKQEKFLELQQEQKQTPKEVSNKRKTKDATDREQAQKPLAKKGARNDATD